MSWQGLLRQQLVHSPKKTSKNQAENIEERNKWWKRWNKSGNVQIWSRIWLVDFRTRGIFTLVISIQKMAPRCIFVYNSSSFLSGFELSMIWELESRLFQNSKKCPWKTIFFCVFSVNYLGGGNLQCSIGYDIFIHGPCSKNQKSSGSRPPRTKVQIEKTPCKSEENELPSFCYFEATSYYSTDCHWWDQWRIQRCVFWRIPSFSLRIQGPLWNQFNIFIWSTVWSQNPSDCILISVTRPLFGLLATNERWVFGGGR